MSQKTRGDVVTAIVDLITDAYKSTSPTDLRSVLGDIADSFVNILSDPVLTGLYTYSATRNYKTGELTYYGGSFYVANTDITAEAFSVAHWDLVSNQIYKFSVAVSTAELLALFTTPKTIVAAVSGKRIQPLSSLITLTYNSVAYATNTSPYLYIDTATLKIADFTEQLAATATRAMAGIPYVPLSPVDPASTQLIANKALKLTASANPTAGNSGILVEGTYVLI